MVNTGAVVSVVTEAAYKSLFTSTPLTPEFPRVKKVKKRSKHLILFCRCSRDM